MSWLFEDPTMIIVAGVIIEAVLAAALFVTGRGKLLLYMAGVLAVTGGLVLVERLVVTDRERIEAVIDDLADAIETNDGDRVVAHISPANRSLRTEAKSRMKRGNIQEVRLVDNPEIRVEELSDPPVARARFAVLLVAHGFRLPQEIELWFRMEDGQWRIFKYKNHGMAAAVGR